jgi:NADH-quinone oxidoreductase subunit A
MDEGFQTVRRADNGAVVLTEPATYLYRELGITNPTAPTSVPPSLANVVTATDPVTMAEQVTHAGAQQLAWVTVVDIIAFFAVLMIGFAYVWRRGDLDWVRAVGQERATAEPKMGSDDVLEQEAALSA